MTHLSAPAPPPVLETPSATRVCQSECTWVCAFDSDTGKRAARSGSRSCGFGSEAPGSPGARETAARWRGAGSRPTTVTEQVKARSDVSVCFLLSQGHVPLRGNCEVAHSSLGVPDGCAPCPLHVCSVLLGFPACPGLPPGGAVTFPKWQVLA